MQLPPAWTGPLAAGVGGVAYFEGATGYALVGGEFSKAAAWHVGGGYGTRQSSSTFRGRSPAWVGSVAVELKSGFLRTQLFAQYSAGRIPEWCFDDPVSRKRSCTPSDLARTLSLGLSLGRQQHNASKR